jgi:hypothetical protein
VPRIGKQLRIEFFLPILTVPPPIRLKSRSHQFIESLAGVKCDRSYREASGALAVHEPARDVVRAVHPGPFGFLDCRGKSPLGLLFIDIAALGDKALHEYSAQRLVHGSNFDGAYCIAVFYRLFGQSPNPPVSCAPAHQRSLAIRTRQITPHVLFG